MTITEYLRRSILTNCGYQENSQRKPSLKSLRETEWSPAFEKHMRERLIMGGIRYGLLHEPGKPKYDRIQSAIKRLEKYRQTGNLENLVDIANMCLLEFEEGEHPNRHFKSIDDGEHTEVK